MACALIAIVCTVRGCVIIPGIFEYPLLQFIPPTIWTSKHDTRTFLLHLRRNSFSSIVAIWPTQRIFLRLVLHACIQLIFLAFHAKLCHHLPLPLNHHPKPPAQWESTRRTSDRYERERSRSSLPIILRARSWNKSSWISIDRHPASSQPINLNHSSKRHFSSTDV